MIFVGDDWAEAHHDVAVQDERDAVGAAAVAGRGGGVRAAACAGRRPLDEPGEVVIGIETDRGVWVPALVAAGYVVYAINPIAAARYRERHTSRAPRATPVTRTCSPSSSAPTATTIAPLPATVSWPRRQDPGPGPPEPDLDPATPDSTSCARRCGSSTPRRSRLSVTTWPSATRWRSSTRARPRRRAARCRKSALVRGAAQRGRQRNLERERAQIQRRCARQQLDRPPSHRALPPACSPGRGDHRAHASDCTRSSRAGEVF